MDSGKKSTSDMNDMAQISQLWYQMFLSTLISSIVIHSIGSFILLVRLRSHHYAKWLALLVQLAGFLTPIFLGSVTNALIASILVISNRYELPFYIVISIGLAQTLCVVAMQFLKIIQTLWERLFFFLLCYLNLWSIVNMSVIFCFLYFLINRIEYYNRFSIY